MHTVPVGLTPLGIVVALFFQCMATLLSPADRSGEGIRWARVVHIVALFLFLTIPFGIGFYRLSIEYINNREFPGNDIFSPGPTGYNDLLQLNAGTTFANAMFPLNQWLADGLLVSPILSSLAALVHNVGHSSSYTGVMSFTPRTIGSWPYHT